MCFCDIPKAPPSRARLRSSRRARPEQQLAALELHDVGTSGLELAHLPNWRKTHALLISAHGSKKSAGCCKREKNTKTLRGPSVGARCGNYKKKGTSDDEGSSARGGRTDSDNAKFPHAANDLHLQLQRPSPPQFSRVAPEGSFIFLIVPKLLVNIPGPKEELIFLAQADPHRPWPNCQPPSCPGASPPQHYSHPPPGPQPYHTPCAQHNPAKSATPPKSSGPSAPTPGHKSSSSPTAAPIPPAQPLHSLFTAAQRTHATTSNGNRQKSPCKTSRSTRLENWRVSDSGSARRLIWRRALRWRLKR